MDDVIQQQENHQQQHPGGESSTGAPHKKPLTSRLMARDSKAVTSVLQAVGAQARKTSLPSMMRDDEESPPIISPPNNNSNVQVYDTKPIADVFPSATVIFGDLVGFTAWSSVRQPTEVFILLETLYNAFDQTARKGGIFKVETIGDCYSTLYPCDCIGDDV
jgi:Adenylate and Guanylate cyclase catalytic domain